MSTPRDLIKDSLKLIGVLSTGETPSAEEQADALRTLNRMIDGWSTENLLIYSKPREVFPLIASQQSYTMGVGGNFDTARPQFIEEAYLQYSNNPTVEVPIEIINREQWGTIPLKGTSSNTPTKLYPTNDFPLITLNFWPTPSDANSVVLYSWKPLTSFSTVSQTVSLPPGYEEAIVSNLGMKLSPEYGKQIDPAIALIASDSLSKIKRMNIVPIYLNCDVGVLQRSQPFNIYKGPF